MKVICLEVCSSSSFCSKWKPSGFNHYHSL